MVTENNSFVVSFMHLKLRRLHQGERKQGQDWIICSLEGGPLYKKRSEKGFQGVLT